LALAASGATFSLAAYEAWIWGWSFVTVTSAGCAAFAAAVLAWRGRRAPAPVLAALAAAVAAYSFTNGLLLLGLVPLALALASRYQTFAALFWITVLVVSALAAHELGRVSSRRRIVVGATAGIAACLLSAAAIETWAAAREPVRTRVEALRRGRECVLFHTV